MFSAPSYAGSNENTLLHMDQRSHDQPQHWLLAASTLGLQFCCASAKDTDRHGGAGATLVQDPGFLARGGYPCASHGIAAGLHPELMAAAAAATGQANLPGKCIAACTSYCLAACIGYRLCAHVRLCLADGTDLRCCMAACVRYCLAAYVGHYLSVGLPEGAWSIPDRTT